MIADLRFHRIGVEVTDRHDRHAIRRVPIVIQRAQPLVGRLLDDLGQTDRQAVGVARTVVDHRDLLAAHALAGALAAAPLLEHDAAFLVDFLVAQRGATREIGQHREPAIHQCVAVGRHFEHVDCFVERGVGICVGAKPQSDRLEVGDDFLGLEVLRAVEVHVLIEVREPALVILLDRGAGVHHEPQGGALLGLVVDADVVAQPIRQHAGTYAGVEPNRVGQGRRRRGARGGRRGGRSCGRGRRRGRGESGDRNQRCERQHGRAERG